MTSARGDFIPTACTGLLGLAGIIGAAILLSGPLAGIAPAWGAALVVTMGALPMVLHDLWIGKVHRHPSAGLVGGSPSGPDAIRCAVKWVGLLVTLLLAAFAYWLIPEYHKASYQPFFEICRWAGPALLVLSIPYFVFMDGRMKEPCDGYWHTGLLALGQWKEADRTQVRAHLAGWAVKAFFLPLMATFLMDDVRYLQANPIHAADFSDRFPFFFRWAQNLLYLVDLALATIGYSLTLRVLNSHIRSTEPTALGWGSALICYQPFWTMVHRFYFDYRAGSGWMEWLEGHPQLRQVWGCFLLGSLTLFSLCTVCFGLRFSNLTHRGIIRFGPYAWTRHPAYVAKMAHHFLDGVPFVLQDGWLIAIRRCLLFVAVAAIYRIRAKTEERHLSLAPSYREYSEEIRQRHARWWSAVKRILPTTGKTPAAWP